jgi:hypothetical protein
MTKDLDKIKLNIIKEVMSIDEEGVLTKIEQDINSLRSDNELWSKIIQPTRPSLSLEEMKKEQKYRPIQKEDFFALAEAIEIEESIEELLAQLD